MHSQRNQSKRVCRLDRLRHLSRIVGAAGLLLVGCKESGDTQPAPKRFAAVKTKAAKKATRKFCEKTFGQGTRAWAAPPSRPLPAAAQMDPNPKSDGWTWVNLWASWCGPCIEEMPLMHRWKRSLAKEGLSLKMELWSVDAEAEALKGALDRKYPGEVKWLRGEDDLPQFLTDLGLTTDAPIPIHAFVDPTGHLRCVRVGKVAASSYGAIKTLISQGI